MYNAEQEQRRLAEENQARLFYFISHHVFQMNQLLKCSICFDVYEKPTTVFHCFHVFCEDCIKTYLDFSTTKEPPCPICQKPIPRNDLRPNNVLAKVAEFVTFARGRIDKAVMCDVSKPPSFETILNKIKEKKNSEISLQSDFVKPTKTPPPDYNLILKARKILITPNNKVISTVEELPRDIPSVSFRDGSLKTPISNKRNSVATQHSVNKKKDLFDVVKESSVANPFFKRNKIIKTYTVQKQPKNENRANTFADKIIQFEDDSNKVKIIQWLNDSRNIFDSTPLTQQKNVPESQLQFDMPSVSQIHKHKIDPVNVPPVSQINRQKLEQNKIRQKSKLVTHLSRIDSSARNKQHKKDNRRTRSLESCIKIIKPNHMLKRHSISSGEKIIIEQFNSEDEFNCKEIFGNAPQTTAIVNLIEEECLKNIEAEVLQNKTEIPAKRTINPATGLSSPKRSKRLSSKRLSTNSSGWARMKEIKKTIRKVEIKPKRLNVSGVSRCSSTVISTTKETEGANKTFLETTKISKGKKKIGQPVVLLERMDNIRSKNNAYDLDVLESYFSKQLANTEMQEKVVKNIKNKVKQESSSSAENSSRKKQLRSGNIKSKSSNILVVSAIIHNTDQDNSNDDKAPKIEKTKPKFEGEESKNNSKQVGKTKVEPPPPINIDKIEKKKSKSIDKESEASLNRITKARDCLSTMSALKLKFKAEVAKSSSKQVEKVETQIIIEKEKSKSNDEEPKTRLIRATKAVDNLSTTLKSRKKLFDDDKSENVINETIKEKNTSLIIHNDEPKKKKIDTLSPSTSTFVKEKSNLNAILIEDSTLAMEEKSKLEMQKFAEECVKLMGKTSKDTHIQAGTALKSDSTLFESHQKTNMDDHDDDIFMLPTQVILGKENEKRENIIADNDEIFTMATQVIQMDTQEVNSAPQDKSLESILKHKIELLHDILNKPNFIAKIKRVLKDIEQTISNEHEPKTCKLINDAQIQTENSFISHDATTQTVLVSPEVKIKHAAMQTDSCDTSRGFRISSTDLFNTRPIIHTEMQTDAMACPKCSFVMENNSKTTLISNPTVISSDALLRDSNIIKNLSEKYLLSASFDHIDFETQDVIKGRDIKGSSASLKSSEASQNKQNKENHSENKIENKQSATSKKLNDSRLLQKPKVTTSVVLTSQTHKKTLNTKPYKRIRKPSSDSDSDDGLPKNVKKNKFIQDDLSLHFASELQKETTQPSDDKAGEGDEFLLSGESEGINYREYLQNVLKKCDEELMSKKSAPQQKTSTVEPPQKRSKTQDMIEECKLILQEACSGAITLENTENFNNAREDIPKPTKLTLAALEEEFQHNFSDDDGKNDIMEIDEDCNNVCNVTNFGNQSLKNNDLEKKVENRNKFSESLFSTADHFSKSIGIIPIPSQPSACLDAHNKSKSGNELEAEKEKMKAEANLRLAQSSLNELVDVLDEFNNSFEEKVENETLTEHPKNVNKNNNDRIVVLQNIVIGKNNSIVHHDADPREDITAAPRKKTEAAIDKENESDDMFLSDSDVVETTPQKNKPVSLEKLSFLSQAYYNPEEKIVLPPLQNESPDIVSSLDPAPFTGLGEVFMPPPEFQDTPVDETLVDNLNVDNERVNLSVIEVDVIPSQVQNQINRNVPLSSSLTPDLLLPQTSELDCNIMNTTEAFITSTPYTDASQILPSRSLNLSPISMRPSNKAINPIQAAQKSKVSPLTLIKSKTPPPQRYPLLVTSTPKQKSILNYVRSSENANTKSEHGLQSSQKSEMEPPINKKPCVACTRMSKEQLLTITSLSNKKLISYSNTFSAAVTHMIVDVNEQNRVKDHTMKFVSAVAAGIWVLNFTWVEECTKQGRLLPEDPFEALDMTGVAGPKKSRLMKKSDPLLKGYKIHAAPPFKSTTQKEVEGVIKLLGGEVVPRLDDLISSNGKVCLIITEAGSSESEDFDMYETWLDMLKVATVDLEWLSRSVGQYERLSLKPFALCSEESICDLGYPAELLTDIPLSFSHTM